MESDNIRELENLGLLASKAQIPMMGECLATLEDDERTDRTLKCGKYYKAIQTRLLRVNMACV
jgi:hypothetical protein